MGEEKRVPGYVGLALGEIAVRERMDKALAAEEGESTDESRDHRSEDGETAEE